MSDLVTLTGMVLSSMPIGEYDKRLVLLTRQGADRRLCQGSQKTGKSSVGGQPSAGIRRLFSV